MTSERPSLPAVLYQAASRGVLPLTSRCNVQCVFCSHGFNPPGVEVYTLPDLPRQDVVTMLDWLNTDAKVVMGEATTRIKEGEPLLYAAVWDVLSRLREMHPQVTVQMTTNGSLLTQDAVEKLRDLNIELMVSLNSVDKKTRQRVMKESDPVAVPRNLKWLGVHDLCFEGSIVAMPHITGYEDIHETALFLAEHGARCIRIFEPGFTKRAPASLLPSPDTRNHLADVVEKISSRCGVPVLLEPSLPVDLRSVVTGVMPDSPAGQCGLRRGDRIVRIDGVPPFSRVEAFRLLGEEGCECIELSDGRTLDWKPSAREGLIMDYDLDPDDIQDIQDAIEAYGAKRPLIVTSVRAKPLLNWGLSAGGQQALLLGVKPDFFGGSIACTGLLTLGDIRQQLREAVIGHDLVLLPPKPFDAWGRDLLGEPYHVLESQLGIPCRIVGRR